MSRRQIGMRDDDEEREAVWTFRSNVSSSQWVSAFLSQSVGRSCQGQVGADRPVDRQAADDDEKFRDFDIYRDNRKVQASFPTRHHPCAYLSPNAT